jgi:hypothetical protein
MVALTAGHQFSEYAGLADPSGTRANRRVIRRRRDQP